jgi:DNA-binding PadR family transcriptional regulator
MYRDRSLIPSEALRLAALGSLALEPRSYAELAAELRQFAARIVGPSLDLVGPPLALLTVEGLVEEAGAEEGACLRITPAGRAEFERLMGAALRPPVNDLNKLALALKLRFLDLLGPEQKRIQAEAMVEMAEQELTRLRDLLRRHRDERGLLPRWLEHEIGQAEGRLDWFRSLLAAS